MTPPRSAETVSPTRLRGVEAVVLVGGQGMRLRPLTLSAPKPMLPTAGVPFLSHLLSRIRAAGITHVVLGTSYQAEVFSAYFGDGSRYGLELEYEVEREPLDTAGAIRNVFARLREPDVLVFNGDIMSSVDLGKLVETHRASEADVTLHLVKVGDPRRFGCVPTESDGRVVEFLEKTEHPPVDQINAGCYVFRRPVIESIPPGRPVSVERETFPGLLASGARLQGYVDASYWLDIGTPEAFVRCSSDLVLGTMPSAALPGEPGDALVLPGARISESAELQDGTAVGLDCVVAPGARISGSTLFDGARVDENAVVERSVIGAGAHVGAGCVVRDAILGDRVLVGEQCELVNGVRVWPDVRVPAGGVRFSGPAS